MLKNSGIRNRVKEAVCNDARLFHLVNHVRSRDDIQVERFLRECASIDSIEDVTELRKMRLLVGEGKMIVDLKDSEKRNAYLYGIWESMYGSFDYPIYMTPVVEHGVVFYHQVHNEIIYGARASIATFGSYRKRVIREYLDVPVFCVGPYIEYATSYYDSAKVRAIKGNRGKTLLVFPTHGFESMTVNRSMEESLRSINAIAKDFDSVMVCFFWWDLNDKMLEAYKAEGYHIVSAGTRYDKQFLSRLRTIIELSDYVIGDGIGTNVGYCLQLGKRFRFVDTKTSITKEGTMGVQDSSEDLSFAFDTIEACLSNEDVTLDEAKKCCEQYWGFSKIRTRAELLKMCELTALVYELAHGKVRLYPTAAQQLLGYLEDEDSLGYRLLSEALQ